MKSYLYFTAVILAFVIIYAITPIVDPNLDSGVRSNYSPIIVPPLFPNIPNGANIQQTTVYEPGGPAIVVHALDSRTLKPAKGATAKISIYANMSYATGPVFTNDTSIVFVNGKSDGSILRQGTTYYIQISAPGYWIGTREATFGISAYPVDEYYFDIGTVFPPYNKPYSAQDFPQLPERPANTTLGNHTSSSEIGKMLYFTSEANTSTFMAAVYDVQYFTALHQYSHDWGRYFVQPADDGYEWLVLYYRTQSYNGNPDIWRNPDYRNLALQYENTLIYNTSVFTARDPIWELQKTPYGYYSIDNGAEWTYYMQPGESNAIDGYIIYEIPVEHRNASIWFTANYGGYGSGQWEIN